MLRRSRHARLSLWYLITFVLAAGSSAPAQGRFAKVNAESLYYEIAGEGPPLVLIHGWSLNLRMWDPQVAAWSRQFRVIRYDRRGFGKSSGNEDVTWDAEDLRALLDEIGATRVHILGMSQGARAALAFARRYPERVSSLTLQGAPAPDGFGLPWSGADRMRFDEWTTIARGQGLDSFRRVWAAHPLMKIPADRPAAVARLDELLAAYRGGRLLNQTPPSGPVPAVTMDDLAQITVPTLILTAASEVPYLKIVARALAYYIPNARLVEIPGGGHMLNLIEPDRYSAEVLRFLTASRGERKR